MDTSSAKLSFTLVFSFIFHGALLLGVGFSIFSPPNSPPMPNLDITLVKHQTELAPEEADYLAQANSEGGGLTNDKSPNPVPETQQKEADQTDRTPVKPRQAAQAITVPTPAKTVEKTTNIVAQKQAERQVETQQDNTEKTNPTAEITPQVKPRVTASEIMVQARNDINLMEQRLDLSTQASSKKPNRKILSSRTKEYAAAAYHEAWVRKVERIGNLNYPQEARQQRINGSLKLAVDIQPDGSVPPGGIVITHSSGHKVLDDAAIKIVRLAAPYAPIPENVLQGHDVITIIRTWKFETDDGLYSR